MATNDLREWLKKVDQMEAVDYPLITGISDSEETVEERHFLQAAHVLQALERAGYSWPPTVLSSSFESSWWGALVPVSSL